MIGRSFYHFFPSTNLSLSEEPLSFIREVDNAEVNSVNDKGRPIVRHKRWRDSGWGLPENRSTISSRKSGSGSRQRDGLFRVSINDSGRGRGAGASRLLEAEINRCREGPEARHVIGRTIGRSNGPESTTPRRPRARAPPYRVSNEHAPLPNNFFAPYRVTTRRKNFYYFFLFLFIKKV